MSSPWVKLGLGAVALFSDTVLAHAELGGKLPRSPGYNPKISCPGRCSTAGPNPGDWSLYRNLDQIGSCDHTMFYHFSLLDPVDDPSTFHRIYSCSSYGPDWSNLPNATGNAVLGISVNSTYQFSTENEGGMSPPYVRSLSRQIREYLTNGFGAASNSVILFARAGKTSVGLYIGKGLQNEGTSYFALTSFESAIASAVQGTGTVAMQLCQPGNDGDHVFGIMATSNSTFEPIQEALRSWSNAECLSFSNTTNITGPAYLTTPLVLNLSQTHTANSTIKTNSTSGSTSKRSSIERLQRRDTCSYVQAASSDGCPTGNCLRSDVNFSERETITGNWTSVQCTDPAVNLWAQDKMSAEQRWSEMGGDDAWTDVTNQWINVDQPDGDITFIGSVLNSIHGPELVACESIGPDNNCQMSEQCWFDPPASDGSPAAGAVSYEIYNSLCIVHEMFQDTWDALWTAAAVFEPSLPQFESIFAPVAPQPSDEWLQILLSFITLGATALAAPIFNSFLSELPYFSATTLDTTKDITYAAIQSGVSVGLVVVSGQETKIGTWTVQDQNAFSTYMGQVVGAWANLTNLALHELLSGSSTSLPNLDILVTGGKLIAGIPETDHYPPNEGNLTVSITSAFYAYAIPAIWSAASYNVFVIDSGTSCGTTNPITKYMTVEDQETSWGCYPRNNGELYYLAMPVTSQFKANCGSNPPDGYCPEVPFTAPPGLSALTGESSAWGAVTRQLLIQGAVRSYQANHNANGGFKANSSTKSTVDGLIEQDYTTPGFINIPVCTPEMAATAVDASDTTSGEANYPCAVPPSPNDCGTSTFTDAISDASPLVTDCQQIVANIAGTDGSWEVEAAVGKQHQLVQSGTCAFGVTGTIGMGDVAFHVGAQDIVDLINSSVQTFAWNGLVGASGSMSCQGDAGKDNVKWGIYHT